MVKIKFPALSERKFKGIFVCKNCSTKIRADMRKIIEGKVNCRRCRGKLFRPRSKTTSREKK